MKTFISLIVMILYINYFKVYAQSINPHEGKNMQPLVYHFLHLLLHLKVSVIHLMDIHV